MSFRIQQSPNFWATVEVMQARAEGGSPEKRTFDLEFPRMTATEFKAFNDAVLRDNIDDKQAATMLILGTWKTLAYGADSPEAKEATPGRWKGVTDVKDNPLEVSEGNVAGLLAGTVGIEVCITRTFYREVQRATSKNL